MILENLDFVHCQGRIHILQFTLISIIEKI